MSGARRRDGIAAPDIAALDIGAHAASRLSKRSRGRVLAVFARGVHVLFDEGLVLSIGDASFGSGPTNLLVAGAALDALGHARPGDAVTTPRRGVLRVARKAEPAPHDAFPVTAFGIDWTEAPRYRTPPLPPAPDTAMLRAARARLAALGDVPTEGFGWRLHATVSPLPSGAVGAVGAVERITSPNRFVRAFRDTTRIAARALDDWLVDVTRDGRASPSNHVVDGSPLDGSVVPAPTTVCTLLGAGPGLTPSGDDLLGGVLLALHRLERADAADALWRTLAPALDERTHPFSAAQLTLAASGEHAAPVRALIEAVFDDHRTDTPDRTAPTLRKRLDAIGATSGWDLAAGIAAVIGARLAAGDRPMPDRTTALREEAMRGR